jgi:hypothetical protein
MSNLPVGTVQKIAVTAVQETLTCQSEKTQSYVDLLRLRILDDQDGSVVEETTLRFSREIRSILGISHAAVCLQIALTRVQRTDHCVPL